jgi:hypothetical protein
MDILETLNEAGVDEEQLKEAYKNSKSFIPKDWHGDIIKLGIDNTNFKPENINVNKKDRVYTLQFKNEEDSQKFEDLFNIKLMPTMTQYILEVKKENPKKYQRTMVLETKQDGITFNIYY